MCQVLLGDGGIPRALRHGLHFKKAYDAPSTAITYTNCGKCYKGNGGTGKEFISVGAINVEKLLIWVVGRILEMEKQAFDRKYRIRRGVETEERQVGMGIPGGWGKEGRAQIEEERKKGIHVKEALHSGPFLMNSHLIF